MPDKLLVNVERNIESEEGYRSTELFWREHKDRIISENSGTPDAVLESYSRRWLANPVPEQHDSSVLTDWSATSTTLADMDRREHGGYGIEVTSEPTGGADAWSVVSTSATAIEAQRGYYLDFLIYQANALDKFTEPLVFWFGYTASGAYKYKLAIRGNEQSALNAELYERNPDYDSTDPDSLDYRLKVSFPLLAGNFYNQEHRLWIQPLDGAEFLIRNQTDPLYGTVVATKAPEPWPIDDGEGGTEDAEACWLDSPFKVDGWCTGWFVLRVLTYPAAWSIAINRKQAKSIGYTSTQDWQKEEKWYAPDKAPTTQNTQYVLTTTIYDQDAEEWSGGGEAYAYTVALSAPEDAETSYTKRTAVIDSLKLWLAPVSAPDRLVRTDLLAHGSIRLLALQESRTTADADAKLTITVRGRLSEFQALDWPKPNGRCQWLLDTGELEDEEDPLLGNVYYLRFDGYIADIQGGKWTSQGTYMVDYQITLRNHWRIGDLSLFRGSIGLDGMTRSEVYDLLAEQMLLDPTTEVETGTLTNDVPLPESKPGTKPSLMPRIGSSITEVFSEVLKTYGLGEVARFVASDAEPGLVKLRITAPDETSQATLYRTTAEAVAGGTEATVIIGGLQFGVSDADYYNDILVIGQDKKDPSSLVYARYMNPDSWQTPASPYYVGIRRLLIRIDPAYNTQAICNQVCYGLFQRFGRFVEREAVQSYLDWTLYPGDFVTIDAGEEPGASDKLHKIVAMRVASTGASGARRYEAVYELSSEQ